MTDASRPPEWDSKSYHRVSDPHVSWGKKVLSRLTLRGDETILDAGCGTGRLTAELLTMLPRGRVVGVDLSPNMLVTAREYLRTSAHSENFAVFVQADLLELPFARAFDGIFSAATFHWVLDHDWLFRGLFESLLPGGWLCAQCGGGPNLAKLVARVDALSATPPYSPYLAGCKLPCEFSDAETAAGRLHRAGFSDIETSLEAAPTRFDTMEEYSQFVETVILRTYFENIPEQKIRADLLSALVRQAADDHPPFELDYWRLNLRARKPE